MKELEGNVALVTGEGRGLGEAICHMLGKSGATVVLTDKYLTISICIKRGDFVL